MRIPILIEASPLIRESSPILIHKGSWKLEHESDSDLQVMLHFTKDKVKAENEFEIHSVTSVSVSIINPGKRRITAFLVRNGNISSKDEV